jgi:predicted ATPase
MRVAEIQPLEREPVLATLAAAVRDANAGRGSVVLLTGEAGIGKTSVVRAFLAAAGRTRVLVGACDDLLTQRAFGPLRDATAGREPAAVRNRTEPRVVPGTPTNPIGNPGSVPKEASVSGTEPVTRPAVATARPAANVAPAVSAAVSSVLLPIM